jgi:hypothetical protein
MSETVMDFSVWKVVRPHDLDEVELGHREVDAVRAAREVLKAVNRVVGVAQQARDLGDKGDLVVDVDVSRVACGGEPWLLRVPLVRLAHVTPRSRWHRLSDRAYCD